MGFAIFNYLLIRITFLNFNALGYEATMKPLEAYCYNAHAYKLRCVIAVGKLIKRTLPVGLISIIRSGYLRNL